MAITAAPTRDALPWGLLLLVICLAVRVPLWLGYTPILGDDTATYERMAQHLSSWDFSGYEGKRPPAYPLLLVLSRSSYSVVWAVQSLLGIATAMLVFSLALRRGARPVAAFVAGLATTLSLNLLLFEAGILTEAISVFLLILGFWLWDRAMMERGSDSSTPVLLATGFVVGVAALVKPFLAYLSLLFPLLTAYAALRQAKSWRAAIGQALAVALPALVLVLGWSAFNKVQLDYFGLTTLGGYNLTQHSGAIMERAPDEYAVVRDIYLKHRATRVRDTGSHSMTIWDAYPEMLAATGQTFPQLSKTLGRLSATLLMAHPSAYAETVVEAWLRFWKAPLPPSFLEASGVGNSLLGTLRALWAPERYLLVAIKIAFLGLAGVTLVRIFMASRHPDALDVAIVLIVLAGSVLQALTEYGQNARYSLPFQPLIYLGIVSALLPPRPMLKKTRAA